MKKVVPILLILFILLTSTCFAAYEPDPKRWIWLGSDDEVGMFLDKETIEYSTDNNIVDCWICFVIPQENKHAITNQKIDKIAKSITMTHVTLYESSNKEVLESHTYKSWEQEPERIIPDSKGEALYRYFFPN